MFVHNLMCVKSTITILLVFALIMLCFKFPDNYSETMKSAIAMVITFYFSHQTNKKVSDKNG